MSHGGTGNRILDSLDGDEFAVLEPQLQEVKVTRGSILTDAGQPAKHLYFPATAVLSLVGMTEGGGSVEVALVGREGVASVATLSQLRLPFRIVVHVEGVTWKIPGDVVATRLRECRALHHELLVYSNSLIGQVGQSAICNRFHTAKQRLARWLLMTADRIQSHELPMTHEFIARMVGGPRSAVTEAAAALRECGAIDYRRGRLVIKNVPKLRLQACECYDAAQNHQPR
jgi:CRP-like cAMP-binding protein